MTKGMLIELLAEWPDDTQVCLENTKQELDPKIGVCPVYSMVEGQKVRLLIFTLEA